MKDIQQNSVGVKLENLTKIFLAGDGKSEFVAVNQISLGVNPGELVTLLGPSGCGKTTILRMLSGFEIPTDGVVYIGDTDMTDTPPNKRDLGMMFQSYALFPHLSVYENIAYGLRIKKVEKSELEKRVADVLELMHIAEFKDRIPEQLSGGQQQRVALARAIVIEPKILLFDEPLSNLDAKMREYMRDELRKIQQRLGITSIYVTHDQSEAMAISDKVVIMNKGEIEQMGTPIEIYERPNNKFVADFMGKAVFLDAKVLQIGEKVTVECMGKQLAVSRNEKVELEIGAAAFCSVRPENIIIDKDGLFEAYITRATYLGSYMEYELSIGEQCLVMVDYNARKNGHYKVDETVRVSIDTDSIHLLLS